jgi:hypothetical protein
VFHFQNKSRLPPAFLGLGDRFSPARRRAHFKEETMRRFFGSLILLSSILLFSATAGNRGPVRDGEVPAPPCMPCDVR